MTTEYRPFAGRDTAPLRALLDRPIRSLAEFAALRGALGHGGTGAALALAAADEPGFSEAFLSWVTNRCLAKPFTGAVLRQIIAEALQPVPGAAS